MVNIIFSNSLWKEINLTAIDSKVMQLTLIKADVLTETNLNYSVNSIYGNIMNVQIYFQNIS